MTGLLVVRDDPHTQWSATGGLYDRVLRDAADEIHGANPAFADLLRRSRMELTGLGYCDLRTAPRRHIALLLEAVTHIHDRAILDWPDASDEDDAKQYAHDVRLVGELKAILRSDPRVVVMPVPAAEIYLPAGTWQGPPWIFDLVLEELACDASLARAHLRRTLLQMRSPYTSGSADSRQLQADDLAFIREHVALRRNYHVERRAHEHPASLRGQHRIAYETLARLLGAP